MKGFGMLIVFVAGWSNLQSQVFQDITPASGIPSGFAPNGIFADIDNDGDPDLIVTGYAATTIIYNDNLDFNRRLILNNFIGETQLFYQTLDVGDFDRDGKVDILQSGGPNRRVFYMMGNNDPSFTNLATSISGIAGSSFFGDFDNDGDLDVLYSGVDNASNSLGGVYINEKSKLTNGFGFSDYPTNFCGWMDLDKDSQLEIVQSVASNYLFKGNYLLERNGDQGVTNSKNLSINDRFYSAAFADHDNDGDFDLLVKDLNWNFRIYNYANGNFTASAQFPAADAALWADMNSDGLPDVVLSGVEETYQVFETRIYTNNGNGTYTKMTNTGLGGSDMSGVSVGDVDGDGDLDLVMIGSTNSRLYLNTATANATPGVPSGLSESVTNADVLLQWGIASDSETPGAGLTYNISVTKDDGTIIVPSHALGSGKRKIFKTGNAFNNTFFKLSCLQEGTYQWTVQSVDASLVGSAFAQARSFTISNVSPVTPTNLTAKSVADNQIELRWSDNSANETYYKISRRVAGDPLSTFFDLITLPKNTTLFSDTLYMTPSTEYEYKVVAANCAYKDEFSSTVKGKTFPRAFENNGWLNLGNVQAGFTLLADFDNDKDLDLLMTSGTSTKLYRFNSTNNKYEDSGFTLPYLNFQSSANFIDLNGDGYLDLFFVLGEPFKYSVKFYLNRRGTSFTETPLTATFPLLTTWLGGTSWADYDNDGDQDILIQGEATFGGEWILKILENKGDLKFQDSGISNLIGTIHSAEPWGDFDNDGDLDILVNKRSSCTAATVGVMVNNGNKTFTYKDFGLQGLNDELLNATGDMKWGDYNNDGYLDILLAGENTCGNGTGMARIYKNSGTGSFTQINTPAITRHIYDSHLQWGDYDNDGDRDAFMFGDPFGGSTLTKIYNNAGNDIFLKTNIDYLLSCVQYGSSQIGDIDNDADLDYVIAGGPTYVTYKPTVFKNNYAEGWGKPNARPIAPSNLKSVVDNTTVIFSWDRGTDVETPQTGLTYQFYLIQNSDTLVSANAHQDGTRKIVNFGNAQHVTSYKIKNLIPGTYRWGVQTIDSGYRGSSFSEEKTFTLTITGLEDQAKKDFLVFPNPTSGNEVQLKINNSYMGEIDVVLTDVLGHANIFHMIKTEENWIGSLAFHNLTSGIWIVSVQLGQETLRAKLIKQ